MLQFSALFLLFDTPFFQKSLRLHFVIFKMKQRFLQIFWFPCWMNKNSPITAVDWFKTERGMVDWPPVFLSKALIGTFSKFESFFVNPRTQSFKKNFFMNQCRFRRTAAFCFGRLQKVFAWASSSVVKSPGFGSLPAPGFWYLQLFLHFFSVVLYFRLLMVPTSTTFSQRFRFLCFLTTFARERLSNRESETF